MTSGASGRMGQMLVRTITASLVISLLSTIYPARQGNRRRPLLCGEVGIARGHGEAVRLAHGGHAFDGGGIGPGEIEIAGHAADHGKLLVEGTAGQDSVQFTGHAAVVAATDGAYDRYVFDSTHELLVQHGITVAF